MLTPPLGGDTVPKAPWTCSWGGVSIVPHQSPPCRHPVLCAKLRRPRAGACENCPYWERWDPADATDLKQPAPARLSPLAWREAGMTATIQHILVPTNFGAASANAIAYATSIARNARARLHLVHVLEQPFTTSRPYEVHLPDTPERRERRYQQALAELRRLASHIDGVEVSLEVRDGTVIESTKKAALDYGADLIVVGTYRQSTLRHVITGSIVDRLLQVAPCPVLAVGNDHSGARPRPQRLVA